MYYNTKASGARIRELRIAKNFTQDDLAEHMNVSRGFISLIESGKKGCSVDVLIVLSDLFGVSIDYLVLGTITYTAPDSTALKTDIQELIGQLEKFRERLYLTLLMVTRMLPTLYSKPAHGLLKLNHSES